MVRVSTLIALALAFPLLPTPSEAEQTVGLAVVDITPEEPIRLTGYGNRREPATEVAQRLHAKALAIGADGDPGPLVFVTVDNCIIPGRFIDEAADRLKAKVGLPRERFVVCASHTHNGPTLTDAAPFLFGEPIPAEHQAAIDRYTKRLVDEMVEVSLAALADRKPARLDWGQGEVGIAANRRIVKDGKYVGMAPNPNGLTDRKMPVLRVTSPDGALRAVMLNVACHCTTLTGASNAISGDWSGYAQMEIERAHPGAVALISIGCGADANPEPRGTEENVRTNGEAVARALEEVLKGSFVALDGPITGRVARFTLPFATLPTREQLAESAKQTGAVGLHARTWLSRLDAGEAMPTVLPYIAQTVTIGDDLAMVFLAGEVVSEYALRLRAEGDGSRIWVSGYSNDVPCYIASKLILAEGGYEADMSMIYYGQPTRFAPEVEDTLIQQVWSIMPEEFKKPRP